MTTRAPSGTALIVALLVLSACLPLGCGGGGEGPETPRERSIHITREGSYQVKGSEDGRVQGVGIYDNGSFRVILENEPRMAIYNRETGEGWLVNLAQKTYRAISPDEALARASFLPHLVMDPYLELEQYWNGGEFRMDTADGRSIKAYLEGPEYLPSAWVAESRGSPFKEINWEYRRVGRVSRANFLLPEGLTPQD